MHLAQMVVSIARGSWRLHTAAAVCAAWLALSGPVLVAQQPAAPAGRATAAASVAAPVPTLPATRLPSDVPPDVARDIQALSGLFQGGGRYRITVGDVIELDFPYVPEFKQTLTVQPDGYVTLRGAGDIQARGLTVADLTQEVRHAYEPILNEPVLSVVLKEFEKPYVVVAGEVARPGKYELRGAMTLTQAIAVAGGKAPGAKLSSVVLFRRLGNDQVSAKQIDVSKMYVHKTLAEDPILRPGDTVYLPRSQWHDFARFVLAPGFGVLGVYANPLR